jgi:hypothetical protein
VSGFGFERCEDIDVQRSRLDEEALSRAAVRRDAWERGRARDFQDRGAASTLLKNGLRPRAAPQRRQRDVQR